MPIIPVTRLGLDGLPSSDPVGGAPCIQVRFSLRAVEAVPGGYRINGMHETWALLDTGADFNVIGREYLADARFNDQVVTSNGLNGAHQSRSFPVTFDLGGEFHTTGALEGAPGWVCPWRVILGRKFLQMTRFHWDGEAGIRSIEFFNNPRAV
jgi:hypothetical protein